MVSGLYVLKWSIKPYRKIDGVKDLAVVGAPHALKGEIPIAFVVHERFLTLGGRNVSNLRSAVRAAVGHQAEPDVILVHELPRTLTGKVTRSVLRGVLSVAKQVSVAEVARSVSNLDAYWSCVVAAKKWLRTQATISFSLLERTQWDNLAFDCHQIAGSPLVPATGWLDLLRRAYSFAVIDDVHFLREARNKDIAYTTRVMQGHVHIVESKECVFDEYEDQVYVGARFPQEEATELPLRDFCRSTWSYDHDIIDDMDKYTHYRRCRAIGLGYSGPFRLVTRVIWRCDLTFRARVSLSKGYLAAMLDAALQVVCSVDALGTGAAFIPFAIQRLHLATNSDLEVRRAIVLGKIRNRTASSIKADFAILEDAKHAPVDLVGPLADLRGFAVMTGVLFSRADKCRRSARGAASPFAHPFPSPKSSRLKPSSAPSICGDCIVPGGAASKFFRTHVEKVPHLQQTIRDKLMELGESIVGGAIDPAKSLFENGLTSLRGVEYLGQIRDHFGIGLESRASVTMATFSDLSEMVKRLVDQKHEQTNESHCGHTLFAHVDLSALNRIVRARLMGHEARNVGSRRDTSHPLSIVRETCRALSYMLRRGFVRYLRIQYQDGLVHFLINPPRTIDLELEVVVPGPVVTFYQTDYNRHFTVREIIRDSERGFYNLLHASGLAHLEHYYRVMFFASRLEARFDVELLEGEPYEMRAHISAITGPLVDIDVSFFKLNGIKRELHRAFFVRWRLMLVVNAHQKRMYDFQHGGAFAHGLRVSDPCPHGCYAADSTDEASRMGHGGNRVRNSILLVILCCLAPPLTLVVTPVLCATIKSTAISFMEAFVVLSALILWIRISLRPDLCGEPVQALMPHG